MKKIIQVPVDNDLVLALDKLAKERGVARAHVIRDACWRMLRNLEEEELDRRYRDGYRRFPEDPAYGEAGAKMAAEVVALEET